MRTVVDGVATVDLDGDSEQIVALASRLRIFAGHAGWSPGQLDAELAEGAWWVVPGSRRDLFSAEPREMWSQRSAPATAAAEPGVDLPARARPELTC